MNCTTVKLWQEWFSPIKQRFSFSFDPIDEKTSPMFHLRLESNVRHENEANFFYSKKKRVVYPSNEDEIFDNETKFVFRQRTSRIDVWWTRQWKYDEASFYCEEKNDELGKRNWCSICELVSDWCVHWSNNRIRSSLSLSILFSFSNGWINGWFHRDVQTVSAHKLTSLCFNASLSNAAPSCVIRLMDKSSIVHCCCWNASWMTHGISLSVSLFHEYETSTGWMIGFGCTDDAVASAAAMVAEGMVSVEVESGGFDDGKRGRLGNWRWTSLRWIIVSLLAMLSELRTSNSRPGKRRISSSFSRNECSRISFPVSDSIQGVAKL